MEGDVQAVQEWVKREADSVERLLAEVRRVIVGQRYLLDRMMIGLLARGHLLLEGVPGLAKTRAVKSMARNMDADFSRIQFTPDLMPTDITGTHVFNLQTNEFSLVKGPVFCTFLLADEINRAPAKTQSALLQAMQERTVTIDRDTHRLSPNFTVFATQNPIEYEGTYPLPEAQKDRFMLKINMDPPGKTEELTLAQRMLGKDAPENTLARGAVQQIITEKLIAKLRAALAGIVVKKDLVAYVVDIVRASRDHQSIMVGAGPRATQALLLSSRAFAALSGRDFVTPDDIKQMAYPVLEHRLILRPEYEIEGLTVKEVIENILKGIAVPR